MTVPAPDGFDWHCAKYEANIGRHGVRFEVAVDAFDDPIRLEDDDLDHSSQENRYWLIGRASSEILYISYSLESGWNDEDVVRLISARIAEKDERHAYAIQAT